MIRHAALVVGVIAIAPGAAAAQAPFEWRGRVAAGKTVEIKGVNGEISAGPSTSGQVEVVARKHARKSDPEDVKIEVLEHEDGVTICAVYPTPPHARRENTCESGDEWHSSTENNDVTVNFTVRVPAGVHFLGRTVNGEVEAESLGGNVRLHTVNGGIRLSTTGYAEAGTVNGSIVATLGRADWPGEVDFKTVNGGITLTLPEKVDAEVRAQTVNGDIETDYPITVRGRFGQRRMTGTIGNGGRELNLSTVNGSIRMKKSG